MKTNLKILYKTPDLDKLAEKHQDFDALMDAVMDEKIRQKKKLYRWGSLAAVAVVTAFLSWLYWGYEPADTIGSPSPQEQVIPATTEREEQAPAKEEQPAIQSPLRLPAAGRPEERNEVATETDLNKTVEKAASAEPVEPEVPTEKETVDSNDLAMPEVTITRKVTVAAAPEEGFGNLYDYLYREVQIPDSLISADSGLYIEVAFTVEADGAITGIEFSKDLPEEVVVEFKEVFRQMPEWQPAKEGTEAVASVVKLPFTFEKKENE